jgi:hypothetical protein
MSMDLGRQEMGRLRDTGKKGGPTSARCLRTLRKESQPRITRITRMKKDLRPERSPVLSSMPSSCHPCYPCDPWLVLLFFLTGLILDQAAGQAILLTVVVDRHPTTRRLTPGAQQVMTE